MYVGLDISKNSTVCVGKDKEGVLLFEGSFPTSQKGFDRILGRVGKDSKFVLEASTHGVFAYNYLKEMGADVKVANPGRIRMICDSEKKTDRNDAEILADLLRTNMLPESYLPNKNERELRDIIRQRKSIVNMRSSVKNKIRAILARDGIKIMDKNVLGVKALVALTKVELQSPVQQDALERLIQIAGTLTATIDDYDGVIRERYQTLPYAKLLDTIPGIDCHSAVHIASAIGDIGRFPSDEELASYAGLAPQTYQSGDVRRDRGLRHGDKLLRSLIVQDAHAAVRCSRRFRKYYLKMVRKKGKQKAIISVSRKMIEIIYVMLTRGEPYNEDYGK